ncbi:MAG TPA: hypothetical protein VG028_14735 [Terriglobia bacterium]|nr:hypothetical protein [Terriglobia bacterium]
MDKLTKFADRFKREPTTSLEVLLDDIEDDLGIEMPHNADRLSDLWRKPHPLNLALQKVGWKFQSFDFNSEILFFVRIG